MPNYITCLKNDLLEQFKGKPNVEAICEVIGKQIDDLSSFFTQLKDERDVYTSIGKQLDGTGDIVVLSRLEAAKKYGHKSSASELGDDEYRNYLIYKILKNTSDCTYQDITKAIAMFYQDENLAYTEDPDFPATLMFNINANNDNGERVLNIPYILPGGVGVHIAMHSDVDMTLYVGFAIMSADTTEFGCNSEVLEEGTYLSDEESVIIMDERPDWLEE